MRNRTVWSQFKVLTRENRRKEGDKSTRFESKRITISIHVGAFCRLGRHRTFAATWSVVLGYYGERRAISDHLERIHAVDNIGADRIGAEGFLIAVLTFEVLDLARDLAVDSNHRFSLCVVRLELIVSKRPIARLANNFAVRISREGSSFVAATQLEITCDVPVRDAAIELCATAHDLSGIAFDRRLVLAVEGSINVWLVVDIRFDVAGIVTRSAIGNLRQFDAFLDAGRKQLIAAKTLIFFSLSIAAAVEVPSRLLGRCGRYQLIRAR